MIVFFAVTVFIPICATAQSSINIGFENGNFMNWQGGTGQCCPITTPLSGIIPGRHTITSGSATDPITGGMINVAHPESQYSCKLGNETGNSESESLTGTFTIPTDSLALVIRYAVVLQNAQHPASKQPRFSYEVTTNGAIPEGCLKQTIIAGDPTVPFNHYADLDILNWQTSVINLTGKSGDMISIRFETGDCEPGGHFGFAYVDLKLVSTQFQINGCDQNGNWMAIAPADFPGIWQNGAATDTLLISGSTDVNYIVNPFSACEFSMPVIPEHLFPAADFTIDELCEQEIILDAITDSLANVEWQTGDGVLLYGTNAHHHYQASGHYDITLTVQGANNCRASVTREAFIHPSPEISFTADTSCRALPFQLHQSSMNCDWLNWYSDGTLIGSGLNDQLSYYGDGLHEITLVGGSNRGCSDTLTKIVRFPSAEDCFFTESFNYAPNAFTPNGDGINDFYKLIDHSAFSVYNRMGQWIYHGSEWNGKYEQLDVQEGVYVVIPDVKEAFKSRKHHPVSLIR